jgi:hypothetical protein
MTRKELLDLRVKLAIEKAQSIASRVVVEEHSSDPFVEEESFTCSHGHENCFNH